MSEVEEMEEEDGFGAPTPFVCTPTIKLIVGGNAKKLNSCPPAATLQFTRLTSMLRYLRFCAFGEVEGISDCSHDELLHTTVWELQSAAVAQLSTLMPGDASLKLWRELLPSEEFVDEVDTFYLRDGPADERLVTHLYIGVKGGVLEWITSGQQLRSILRQIGRAAEEAEDSTPTITFCLRPPPAAPQQRSVANPAAAAQAKQRSDRGPGRPAQTERRVCFELSVGTKQVGQHGAPKFYRTSDAIKQVVVDWREVPGHSVRFPLACCCASILLADADC